MGQKDPLTEWQREGFEMFAAMMTAIAQDFVKYVMHVQVVQSREPDQVARVPVEALPDVQNLRTSSSDDVDASGFDTAARAALAEGAGATAPQPAPEAPRAKQQTVVKDDFQKTPRNAPCPCGSGKKFKLCHGAA
jgi:preprotein translocase subunit SecA